MMKRQKPLKRSPLKRSTKRIKNKGRSRFPKRRDPAYLDWIREQPCCVPVKIDWYPTLPGTIEAAHVKTRGAGGDDLWNTVPMCREHHHEQEGRTREFEKRHNVDLLALAAQYTQRYHDETGRDVL